MITKAYFTGIARVQETLLAVSLLMLCTLPLMLAYMPDLVTDAQYTMLYAVSLFAVFLVMSVRPLADLFPRVTWLRPLVILRKGFGVFSASIIVSFMLAKVIDQGADYFITFFSPAHWSFVHYAFLAPLGDLSALVLLVTSNAFSKRLLKSNWKRIQKLAYVYFYAGALYEYLVLGQLFALVCAGIVTVLVVMAFLAKRIKPS